MFPDYAWFATFLEQSETTDSTKPDGFDSTSVHKADSTKYDSTKMTAQDIVHKTDGFMNVKHSSGLFSLLLKLRSIEFPLYTAYIGTKLCVL